MKKTAKIWKMVGTWILTAGLVVLPSYTVKAAQPGEIVEVRSENGTAVVYVQSPGEVQDISCQIGTTACGIKDYEMIEQQPVSVKTLLLLDNSLSVKSQYREKIKEIMNTIAANRMQGEQISVAAFSDTIAYMLQDCEDVSSVGQVINGVEYIDQETYLTDVLYSLIQDWKNTGDSTFRRIVLVSDGVDNKVGGYTKEELYSLLRVYGCPIYTIISPSGSEDASKYMSALSRITKADSWVLDDNTDTAAIAQSVASSNQVLRIALELPENICDGTEKGIQLALNVNGETINAAGQMQMPFGSVSEETEAESIAETEEAAVVDVDALKAEEAVLWKKRITMAISGIAGIGILLAGLVFFFKWRKKKKKETEFKSAPDDAYQYRSGVEQIQSAARNVKQEPEENDEDKTDMVWQDRGNPILVLSDIQNTSRRFEVPLSGKVILGRSAYHGCQVVLDYDASVSRQHCEIFMKNGKMKVRDLHSRNGISVNGVPVKEEVDLENGSILTVGKIELKVRLRR